MISPIIAFISSKFNCFTLYSDTKQIPLIIDDILSETVSINMELYLLGITVAVLVLFEELIEMVSDPILSAPSATWINNPFSNEIHFK
jgi:hypothetical protein